MHPLLKNKYIQFSLIGVVIIGALYINLFRGSSVGLSGQSLNSVPLVPSNSAGDAFGKMLIDASMTGSSNYQPEPNTDNYTSKLETYETTQYTALASTKKFDELCSAVTDLKADSQVHFKNIITSTNSCKATFYVDESKVESVLGMFSSFSDVEISRNTVSVTRHKNQLESQTSILQQQLVSVQQSLDAAEVQYNEISEFARTNKDAATLSQIINQKLSSVDSLTQRKINLTYQLDRMYQQAADLNDRLGVVQFDVNISRSNPIYLNQAEQKWELAWKELKDAFDDTFIGLTASFGIFILWAIRTIVYLLVIILILRGLFKFHKYIWGKQ